MTHRYYQGTQILPWHKDTTMTHRYCHDTQILPWYTDTTMTHMYKNLYNVWKIGSLIRETVLRGLLIGWWIMYIMAEFILSSTKTCELAWPHGGFEVVINLVVASRSISCYSRQLYFNEWRFMSPCQGLHCWDCCHEENGTQIRQSHN